MIDNTPFLQCETFEDDCCVGAYNIEVFVGESFILLLHNFDLSIIVYFGPNYYIIHRIYEIGGRVEPFSRHT